MKKQKVVLLTVTLMTVMLLVGVAKADSIFSIRQDYLSDDWACTDVYGYGSSDEGFAAVKATKVSCGFGWLKRLCTGQGISESTDITNIARPCYGWARFKYKVTWGTYTTVTDWHTSGESVWTADMTFTLSQASSIEVTGQLRDETFHVLTGYVTDAAD